MLILVPSVGQSSFLRLKLTVLTFGSGCVNALSRANLISTGWCRSRRWFRRCVNALCRAILISTRQLHLHNRGSNVSMPSVGRTSFLLRTTQHWACEKIQCVNALCRAILISTLPSQNRLFKPLCGLVFACNYQSCLIINYNKSQKWAEGKLFFEYNFEAISILWLYLRTAAFSTPCPNIDI